MDQGSRSGGSARTTWTGLAWIGGALAATAAVIIGTLLAVFATAVVVVLAIMTSATLALAALAARAGRKARARAADGDLIEARKVGGHHWVAYGWNERR
jgi:hypothetical protein